MPGLAATRAVSFYLVAAILFSVLWGRKRLVTCDLKLLRFLGLTSLATLAMGAVSWLAWHLASPVFDGGRAPTRLAVVCVLLLASGGTFMGVARLLKVQEASHLFDTVLQMAASARGRISGRSGELPMAGQEPL
jgi:peptidoglycan biosynthesis protein MviN/MurJ (putative lipid II flippase)